jgi:hypothetical protein
MRGLLYAAAVAVVLGGSAAGPARAECPPSILSKGDIFDFMQRSEECETMERQENEIEEQRIEIERLRDRNADLEIEHRY